MAALFTGDVSLQYGGLFVSNDDYEWANGYCHAVRVTDLDGGCGFTGAVLVEKVVVNGVDCRKRKREAIRSGVGMEQVGKICWCNGRVNREVYRLLVADALASYGYTDPDEDYVTPYSVVIQEYPEGEGAMTFDGWKADYRLPEGEDLRQHVEAEYVDF